MLSNFKIATKIFAVVGFLCLVSMIIAGVGMNGTGQMEDMAQESNKAARAQRLAAQVNRYVVMMNRAEYALAANPAEVADIEKSVIEIKKQARDNFSQLEKLIDDKQAAMLANIRQNYDRYENELQSTITRTKSVGAVTMSDAQKIIYSEVLSSRVVADKLREGMTDFANYTNNKADLIADKATETGDRVGWILMLVAGFGVAVGAGGAWAISNFGVVKPLTAALDCLRRLANGELNLTIVGKGRRDEIGDMADAMLVFQENAVQRLKLQEQQEAEQQQRLARATRIQDLVQEFESTMGNVLEVISSATTELEATANSMSSTAEQTEQQSSAVASASEQATANVETMAAATEELAATVQEVTRQMHDARTIADEAAREAGSSREQVEALEAAGERIGDVVAMIQDVAGQTNLLALNATIEAARAGEAGKGFAVVASEVKQLANQTARATDDIRTQVEAMRASIKAAADKIGHVAGVVDRLNRVAASVASAAEQQAAATAEIGRNASEAARGTQEVSATIHQVREAAGTTASAAGQVLASAGELAHKTVDMRQGISRFIDGVRAA
ncbi:MULTISPECIES: methyl-accepting chemotaxis protein [unclassified Azospirillum]|uniref:methyl-accepting chemotaxis protein n=1 Tax=unclassified Azospirillum TaxID=2630922 RepID=UPI000B6255BF|nr:MULTISPECIES: methyl-accepting chemotaxis protein [unclassified Azospirillum]SNR95068.1 methyl-accepting chemotaxis protein [Azospirillum sp. RU38E]SNS11329.1 methyl-accepting chemotaxis protein [Azospirillum sp. RU37A]